jgi:type IV secretory pathway VirB4 component
VEWLTDSIRKELKRAIDVRERELLNISCHAHILRSIRYEKMKERSNGLKQRLSEIEDQQRENGGTFQWIFESETSNVTDSEEERMMKQKARKKWNEWITSTDAGIFHIAGKFGSGKSTLMQFLYDHPRTQQDLEQWAGKCILDNRELCMH